MAGLLVLLGACATPPSPVRRLSPVFQASQVPAQCKLASVMPDSPAQKAGLQPGDVIQKVNGAAPANASTLADLVNGSGEEMATDVLTASGTERHVTVHLNASRPRLGAVCDLTGWRKSGVTSAGNESETVFDGPYAVTTSGIIDKGLVFMRVRVTNNADKPLTVSPELFSMQDGHGAPVKVLLGTNIKSLGFAVAYQKFADGVWFPVSYGGEFEVRAVFFYKRTISVSLVNSDFRRADVTTNIAFALEDK